MSKKKPSQSAFERAVGWLARREHSAQEIDRKLRQAGFEDADERKDVLRRLVEYDYQNDARFALAYARSRQQKGWGQKKIVFALREKGIDSSQAQAALDELEVDWRNLASDSLEKRFGLTPFPEYKDRARRYRFLAQRGFNNEQINHALNALQEKISSDEN